MKILVLNIFTIAIFSDICNGYSSLSQNFLRRYISGSNNNVGKYGSKQRQPSPTNFYSNQSPKFVPATSTAHSTGYRGGISPSTPSRGYSSRPSTPAFSGLYYTWGARAPTSTHSDYTSKKTSSYNYRPRSIPPSATFLPPPMKSNIVNEEVLSSASNLYGSSASSQSQQSVVENQKVDLIYTSTVKPPTYSISFSTSKSVGLGTNFGNPSYSPVSGPTTSGRQFTGENGSSYWYGASGRGVGGQPRGLVQPPPPYSSSPSYFGGGGKKDEREGEIQESKFNRPDDSQWEGKMYQEIATEPPNEQNHKLSTESSFSSSFSPSYTETQEKRGETETKKGDETTGYSSTENSPSNPPWLPFGSTGVPSYTPEESFGMLTVSSGDSQSDKTTKGDFRNGNQGGRNSFNLLAKENEIEVGAESIESRTVVLPPTKKGLFNWRNPRGNLYEFQYTVDPAVEGTEKNRESKSIKSKGSFSNSSPSANESPIRIVVTEQEFLKELKSLESEPESHQIQHSSSDIDTPFFNQENDNGEYSTYSSVLSPNDIQDLFRLQDTFKNSNEVWSDSTRKISPSQSSKKNKRILKTTTEIPTIFVNFETKEPSFFPVPSPRSFSSKNQGDSNYIKTNAGRTTPYSNPSNNENLKPKKVSYAFRHHSYSKSHSEDINPNFDDQPTIKSYSQRQFKR